MKTGRRIDVLYIRSHNNLVADSIVPLGAITSMNAAPGTKLGVYASECTEAQIRMARMVAVDWHWCFSLPAVRAICEKVRRIHPQVPNLPAPLCWLPLYLAFTFPNGVHFRLGARWDDVDSYIVVPSIAIKRKVE